jgi:hypothetical protein
MRGTLFSPTFKLRPWPGSRVTHTSAHTQGASIPAFGALAKGLNRNRSRIEHPPSVCNRNGQSKLRRRVTNL